MASHQADPNDCVTICFTSGTEGTPKAVPRAHGDWIAMAWGNVDGPRLTDADVLLNPFPVVNMAGISGMFLAWLLSGSVLVLHHPFDLQVFLAQIRDEQVTYTLAPPTLLTRILRQPNLLDAADLSSLRILGSGSAPLSPWLLETWQQRYGLEIINCFGSNEGLCLNGDPFIIPDPATRAQNFPWFGKPGRTWPIRSTRGFESRLIDPSSGAIVDCPGSAGEIWIKGPNVFAGYFTDEGIDRSVLDDGFFATGEIFQIVSVAGKADFLRYVSRAKDLIVRGGMNISPAELEALIIEHPAVAEVAVIGVDDSELGERTAAVVVLADGARLTLEDLVAFLRGKEIASYKLPEYLYLVDELPRNPVGKVLKHELRANYSGSLLSNRDGPAGHQARVLGTAL